MAGHTWDEAIEKWLDEKQEKSDWRGDVAKAKWLQPQLTGKDLTEISRDLVRSIVERKKTPATRNRYVALIRAVLRKAHMEWRWTTAVPMLMKYAEPKRRIRYLTREQVDRLTGTLPEHQRDIFLFGLATGLRQGNVKRLEWDWVDFDQRVAYVPDTKNGEPLGVALNGVAMSILERWTGRHTRFVFTYGGKPIRNVNTRAWQKARRAAGLHNFRWHDATRHTWASWLAQAGVNSLELQEMGGWKSADMVRRYAALAPHHLRAKAAVIDSVLAG